MTIRPISFYLIIKFGIYCSKRGCLLVSERTGSKLPPANKNNPQGHIIFQGRGPMCPPFAWQTKEAILLYFTPQKSLLFLRILNHF